MGCSATKKEIKNEQQETSRRRSDSQALRLAPALSEHNLNQSSHSSISDDSEFSKMNDDLLIDINHPATPTREAGGQMYKKRQSLLLQNDKLLHLGTQHEIEQKEAENAAGNQIAQRLQKSTHLNKPKKADERIQMKAMKDAPSAVISTRPKTTQEREFIFKALQNHFLFNSLEREAINQVINNVKHYSLNPRDLVFQQGQVGHNFFIVATGHVEIIINKKRIHYLAKGQAFGEIALLHDFPRTATVRAVDRMTLWGLSRKSFREALEIVNTNQYNKNKIFIDSVPLLSVLTLSQKDLLLSVTTIQNFVPDEKIVIEGEEAHLFYIIKEGEVKITKRGEFLRFLQAGSFFGEQALLHNTVRSATITAVTHVTLLALRDQDLFSVLGDKFSDIVVQNSERLSLERSPTLSSLTRNEMEKVINAMKINTYKEGQIVISHGTKKGLKLWIVIKGSLITSGFNKEVEVFESIGDVDLVNAYDIYFEEDFIATQETDVAEISKTLIEQVLGTTLATMNSRNEVVTLLQKISLFKSLPVNKLESLVLVLKERKFSNKEVIFEQNSEGTEFFIVQEGTVEIFINGIFIREVDQYNYFGERSILMNENRTASVVAKGRVTCWVLGRDDFNRLINEGIREQLRFRINLHNESVSLEDIRMVKQLGKGSFGTVLLGRYTVNEFLYAVKIFDMQTIADYDLYNSLINEKHILLSLDHPMIMQLVKTFWANEKVYFLEEYVPGINFFGVLKTLGIISHEWAQFYTACLLLILEHLHEKNIAYRDIKPENIMIDEMGYPKLVNFDTAKKIDGRTYTVVGTPHYLAPEVVKGNGYNCTVDYWSLGVMIYEAVFGELPFGNEEEDPYEIYINILNSEASFPDEESGCSEFLAKMLEKNNALRGDYLSVKKHNWFKNVKWDLLLGKLVDPPYLPEMNQDEDEYELEKLNSEEVLMEKTDIYKKMYKEPPENWAKEFMS